RALDELDAHVISDTRGAAGPFFSPDGQAIGFFADGKLKKISTTGGVVATLADSIGGVATWEPDGSIVFLTRVGSGRVGRAGGGGSGGRPSPPAALGFRQRRGPLSGIAARQRGAAGHGESSRLADGGREFDCSPDEEDGSVENAGPGKPLRPVPADGALDL